MNKHSKIALLRGINVGTKNRMKMADLRDCLSSYGLENIRTYIQSGNIAFESKVSSPKLETLIHDAIESSFGFNVPVWVRDQNYFQQLVSTNPYIKNGDQTLDVAQLHATILNKKPPAKAVKKIAECDFEDQHTIVGDVVFLRLFGAYHKTKLNNQFFEKQLGVAATSRNWKTIRKLVEM